MPRKRKLAEPSIKREDAEQMIKITAVLLRDHAGMDFGQVVHALSYCWRHTESIETADAREAKANTLAPSSQSRPRR